MGRINAVYGLKGWVKVFSYTDPLEQILEYTPWLLRRRRGEDQQAEVIQGRRHGKGLVALLEGVSDRTQAEALIGTEIFVDRRKLSALDEGEFYWYQLQGLMVVNTVDEVLGQVDHLMETGANDVIVVVPTDESIDDQSRLIPYVEDEVVRAVDLQASRIVVDWQADY